MFPSDPLPPDLSPLYTVGISAWYFLPWALGSAPGSQGGLSGSMFLSPEASRSRIRLFCLPLQWVCQCVCTRTALWHSKYIFPQYFASQLRYVPLASKFDNTTQLQMLQKLRFLFSSVRAHFKLASLPLKPTKSKKKKNNKLKSSINTSWFVTEVDKQWSFISNPILLLCTVGQSHYLFMKNQLHRLY